MKFVASILVANLGSLACVFIAGYLAQQGRDGWGWFLFIALLLCMSTSVSDNNLPAKGRSKTKQTKKENP